MRPVADDELTQRPSAKTGFRAILLVTVGILGLAVWIVEVMAEIPEYALPRLKFGISVGLPINTAGLKKELQSGGPLEAEDWSKPSKAEAWRYALYSNYRKEAGQPLSPDYDEVWPRLDPDNALWLLMTVPAETAEADREALRSRIEMASHMAEIRCFREEFFRFEADHYGQPHSWAEAMVIGNKASERGVPLEAAEEAILTEIWKLGKEGDREQLARMLGAGRRIALLMEMEYPGVGYQQNDQVNELIPALIDRAGGAGLPEEKARLAELREAQKLLTENKGWQPLASQWAMVNKGSSAERAMVAMSVRLVWLMAAGGCLLGAGLAALRLLPRQGDSGDSAHRRKSRVWIEGLALPLIWCAGWLALIPEMELISIFYVYAAVVTAVTVIAASYWAAGREPEREMAITGIPGRWLRRAIALGGVVPPVLLGSVTLNGDSSWEFLVNSALVIAGAAILAMAGYWLFYRRTLEMDLRERRMVRTIIPLLLAAGWLGLAGAPVLQEIERKLVAGPVDSMWVRQGAQKRDATAYLQALRALQDQWQGR